MLDIHARLILSIDRKSTYEDNKETIYLAVKYSDSGVVGIDLCGNPLIGDIDVMTKSLRYARDAKVKSINKIGVVMVSDCAYG